MSAPTNTTPTHTRARIVEVYRDTVPGNSAVEPVVNPAWIAGDDRSPQYFYEGTTQDQVQVPEVKTELDDEAMDDLIRYAFPSDLN